MNRFLKAALLALMLFALPGLALADAPVLLVDLPEDAQMVENVAFEGGDFIQTYQTASGVTVQLIRYSGYEATIEDLIASDWPVNCAYNLEEMTELSGFPARHASIFQVIDRDGYPVKAAQGAALRDGEQMMEIDLVVVNVDGTTLIYQGSYLSGQEAGDSSLTILDSLQVQGGESAEVG